VLIHQGGRKLHESASPFGQWVHEKVTKQLTTGDVDQYVRRWYCHDGDERVLLRWLEHKAPGQKFQKAQRLALANFDLVLRHSIECPTAPLQLDPGSGVFVVYSSFANGEPTHITIERLADGETSAELTAEQLGLWIPRAA